MKLRLMSTAVLFNNDEMLMMKRSSQRSISPNMWAGVGGHLEANELNDPKAACLIEIGEETGLTESDLSELRLQYIIIRLKGSEIRQQFIYFGQTQTRDVITCNEGTLHWIPKTEIFNRDIPYVFQSLLRHYFTVGPSPHVWVGTASRQKSDHGETAAMYWSPLTDPELN